MKKILIMLVCLLLCAAPALGQAYDEARLATVNIEGVDYRLGVSTALDLIGHGWSCEVEYDGVLGFYSPENESYFYAKTATGALGSPLVYIDLMWADGVATSYCGYRADGENWDDIPFWTWLTDSLGAEVDEEGALVARVPFADGSVLQIVTRDVRVRLSLTK